MKKSPDRGYRAHLSPNICLQGVFWSDIALLDEVDETRVQECYLWQAGMTIVLCFDVDLIDTSTEKSKQRD